MCKAKSSACLIKYHTVKANLEILVIFQIPKAESIKSVTFTRWKRVVSLMS